MAKSARQAAEDNAPWKPARFDDADAAAIQAVAQGRANIHQQKRAIEWIVKHAANTYDLSYRPGLDGERDTYFAEGRRFVGLQLVKLLNLKIGALRSNTEER